MQKYPTSTQKEGETYGKSRPRMQTHEKPTNSQAGYREGLAGNRLTQQGFQILSHSISFQKDSKAKC